MYYVPIVSQMQYLDEVLDVIEPLNMKRDDLAILKDGNVVIHDYKEYYIWPTLPRLERQDSNLQSSYQLVSCLKPLFRYEGLVSLSRYSRMATSPTLPQYR